MEKITCENCRFWFERNKLAGGECRIRAPSIIDGHLRLKGELAECSDEVSFAVWPNTAPADWCGEAESVGDD